MHQTMPGAQDIIDIVAANSAQGAPIMKCNAALYSSQGVLDGLLTLFHDRLVWNELSDRTSNMLTISTDVLFGATLSPPGKYKFRSFEAAAAANLRVEASTHFTVYTITAHENGRRPLCDTWTFIVGSEEECATWLSLLRFAINPAPIKGDTNALVFLNPVSGKRKSLAIFESVVKPILAIGATKYTLKITESAGYASEFMRTQDLSPYSAIVVVSGDGLLHEVLNGLLRRPDWATYRNIPLGIIPTGTGNGLARSLDVTWPEQAAVALVKAQSQPIDIMSTTLANGAVNHCFLSVTWGLLADVDIESESMRWAGSARLDLYATVRMLNLRYYGGRLHYLPADADADSSAGASASSGGEGAAAEIQQLSLAETGLEAASQGADMPPSDPALPPADAPARVQPAASLHPTLTAGVALPVAKGSLSPRWRTIEGPFVQVIATNVPWLSADFLACSRARITDGAVDLVYSTAVTKWQIFPYLAASAREDHMNTKGVKHVRARAFIIEPTGLRTTSRSDASIQEVQPQRAGASSSPSPSPRPRSLFGSRRSKTPGGSSGTATPPDTPPQVPVPVRVRSQVYTAYHQQTIGRSAAAAAAADLPNGDAEPRPPAQAAFSARSETAAAAAQSPSPAPAVPVARASPAEAEAGAGECRLVGSDGHLVLDGEAAELGAVKVECLPGLLRVICPPWLNEGRTAHAGAAPAKAPEPIAGTLSRERSMLSFGA
ncbi:Sphingosine kinase 1 [Coemansia javaensis]|uniref:Sphingosine kinase 1 n=1 Tax=Coemansia javaensis TaxID=2761396 RepID=A0A9W8HJS1_9FUNG|nr:Sphingosine kinase 1 [Coemansia javaensis]